MDIAASLQVHTLDNSGNNDPLITHNGLSKFKQDLHEQFPVRQLYPSVISTSLTVLDLDGDALLPGKTLPKEIGLLGVLERLDLSHNRLESLPDQIGIHSFSPRPLKGTLF